MRQLSSCLELPHDSCDGISRNPRKRANYRRSTPSASSPKPWTNMKAADLQGSGAGSEGSIIIGGVRWTAILIVSVATKFYTHQGEWHGSSRHGEIELSTHCSSSASTNTIDGRQREPFQTGRLPRILRSRVELSRSAPPRRTRDHVRFPDADFQKEAAPNACLLSNNTLHHATRRSPPEFSCGNCPRLDIRRRHWLRPLQDRHKSQEQKARRCQS